MINKEPDPTFLSLNAIQAIMQSPRYIINLAALRHNLELLRDLKQEASCHIVLALKGFALWKCFPLISEYLDGCCASGLWEAKLSHDKMGLHTLTYSPAYKDSELKDLLEISHHLDFNSPSQWLRYRETVTSHPRFQSGKLKCGIRINPEHSTGSTPIYDPCASGSRLGTTAEQLKHLDLNGITGFHFHTLCEQYTHDLASTLEAIDDKFGDYLRHPEITWLNMGGGHWITKPDYDRAHLIELIKATQQRYQLQEIWLEPGEAIAIHSGVLEANVVDIVHNAGHQIAILDVSATCHMPVSTCGLPVTGLEVGGEPYFGAAVSLERMCCRALSRSEGIFAAASVGSDCEILSRELGSAISIG
ncbi:carboxynorspermidine decarboxylase [Rubritalea tangerina]|uniref:carboxynorspermidine decarboxylase n=1 Tax=Rubritalea tangerina TaxID=430798 RepID=UPI0036142F4A